MRKWELADAGVLFCTPAYMCSDVTYSLDHKGPSQRVAAYYNLSEAKRTQVRGIVRWSVSEENPALGKPHEELRLSKMIVIAGGPKR